MKLLKKLIPVVAIASTFALATPIIASCSCSFDSNEITVTPTAGYEFTANEEGKVEIEFEINSNVDNDYVYAKIFNDPDNKIDLSFFAVRLDRAKVVDKKFKFDIYFDRLPTNNTKSVFSLQIEYRKDGKEGKTVTKPITISFVGSSSFVDVTNGFVNTLPKVNAESFENANAAIAAYAQAVNNNKSQLEQDLYAFFGTVASSVNQLGFDIAKYNRFNVQVLNPSVELDTSLFDREGNYLLKVSFDLQMHTYLEVSDFVLSQSWGEEMEAQMHFEDVPFFFDVGSLSSLTYYTFELYTAALNGEVTYTEPWEIQDVDKVIDYNDGEAEIVSEHNFTATDSQTWDEGGGSSSAAGSQPNIFASSISPWMSLPTNASDRQANLTKMGYRYSAEFSGFTLHNVIDGDESIQQIIGSELGAFVQIDTQTYRINSATVSANYRNSDVEVWLYIEDDIPSNTTFQFVFTLAANFGFGCPLIPTTEWIGKHYEVTYIPE